MAHTRQQLRDAADELFADMAAGIPPLVLISHFSTTQMVFFEHSPINAYNFPLTGLNAVRSYFDLLATHWTRHDMQKHECCVYFESKQVIVRASVRWKWKISGNTWQEDFTCTLDFDDHLKVKSFVIKTSSAENTCVMRAVDRLPSQ